MHWKGLPHKPQGGNAEGSSHLWVMKMISYSLLFKNNPFSSSNFMHPTSPEDRTELTQVLATIHTKGEVEKEGP